MFHSHDKMNFNNHVLFLVYFMLYGGDMKWMAGNFSGFDSSQYIATQTTHVTRGWHRGWHSSLLGIYIIVIVAGWWSGFEWLCRTSYEYKMIIHNIRIHYIFYTRYSDFSRLKIISSSMSITMKYGFLFANECLPIGGMAHTYMGINGIRELVYELWVWVSLPCHLYEVNT